jgi:hypothetical protein
MLILVEQPVVDLTQCLVCGVWCAPEEFSNGEVCNRCVEDDKPKAETKGA